MEDRNFSLQHFRFHLEPKGRMRMPAYNKGNVIRGGFGGTFRRIVCHANCREPETCELRNVCPYTAVFHPFVPEDSEKISKNRDIPRPFVIKPPLETKETYLPGERLSFDVVLVGKTKDYLPYFIVTFKELSQAGLGRHRSPVELCAVGHVGSDGIEVPVYTKENMVQPPTSAISWADLCASHTSNNGSMKSPQDGGRNVTRIMLRFLTPTMLKADGVQVRSPTFGPIAKRLRDRINALSYFYCGSGLDIDFKGFGTEADKICTVQDSTRWVESGRYSRRRQVNHDLSGFIGEVTFAGELAPFLPYLKLGEYVHVGKNAVFGSGWYQIIRAD
ncbi:MAG: CRISPR system precrRNA processing endoribonuclease RAMP protein Cas6 [Candidatus Binatia bacterium]